MDDFKTELEPWLHLWSERALLRQAPSEARAFRFLIRSSEGFGASLFGELCEFVQISNSECEIRELFRVRPLLGGRAENSEAQLGSNFAQLGSNFAQLGSNFENHDDWHSETSRIRFRRGYFVKISEQFGSLAAIDQLRAFLPSAPCLSSPSLRCNLSLPMLRSWLGPRWLDKVRRIRQRPTWTQRFKLLASTDLCVCSAQAQQERLAKLRANLQKLDDEEVEPAVPVVEGVLHVLY